jgi:hypothetical protein
MRIPSSLLTASACALLLASCGRTADTGGPTAAGEAPQGWQEFADDVAGYAFHYPAKRMTLSNDGQTVSLSHEVPFEHPDPCDFKGDGDTLPVIVDFDVSMSMKEKALRDAVIEAEGSDYVATQYMRDEEFIVGGASPVEPVEYRELKGHRITSAVEGCGRHSYYFVSPTGRTFVVQRKLIAEFNAVNADSERLQNVTGILSPTQEELLFERIMSTVRFRP